MALAQTTEARGRLARDLIARALGLLGAMMLLGFLAALLAVRLALAPLARLERAMRARDPKDLTPIAVEAPREVAALVAAIDGFTERLARHLAVLQRFIAEASHQIRTPLAALNAQVEMLVWSAEDPDVAARRDRLLRVRTRAQELARLTNQLLDHAMVSHRVETLRFTPVDLGALARAILRDRAGTLAREVDLGFDGPEEPVLGRGRRAEPARGGGHLVGNALAHGARTRLDVTVAAEGGEGRLTVADDGPGIPPQAWSRVTRPFEGAGRHQGRRARPVDRQRRGARPWRAPRLREPAGRALRGDGRDPPRPDGPGSRMRDRLRAALSRFRKSSSRFCETNPRRNDEPSRRSAGLPLQLCLAALLLAASPAGAAETTRFPAVDSESLTLVLHAATDVEAMRPLIRDFQDTEPHVAVAYTEYVTGELFSRMQAVCRGAGGVDLVLSSSVDQLVKLVNDGCAARLGLAEADPLPRWTRWRDELFGFTFEPAVIVYNADTVPPADRRRTRAELIDLLRSHPGRYAGRIGTYDVTTSGIGYLFSAYDLRGGAVFGRMLEALARADAVLSCCTTDLLARLADGRLAIGYNLLGSYAVAAIRRGAPLRVVVPARPRRGAEPGDLRAGLGTAARGGPGLRALPPVGARPARRPRHQLPLRPRRCRGAGSRRPGLSPSSAAVRAIEIGPELLAIQDRAKRARLIGEWRGAMGAGGPR